MTTQPTQPLETRPENDDGDADRAEDRNPWKRRAVLTIGAVALLTAAGISWAATQGDASAGASDEGSRPAVTAPVVRDDLADVRTFSGPLGHGDPFTVTASGQGVVTSIADPGSQVERGTELFRLDEQPVIALYGEVPMFRDLRYGDSGRDVAQLIANLTQLGYAECDAEKDFTRCVEAAVADWQADLGLTETGIVRRGDVVFVPEGVQVHTAHTQVGGVLSPGAPVLDLTGQDHVVSLDIEVRHRDLLAVGSRVTVLLPDGSQVDATVTAAHAAPTSDSEDPADTIIEVEVTLNSNVDEALLGATAEVSVEVDQRTDVLTVPVNALLALAEGGHGVEVVNDDGTTSLVEVETGLFADGRVEITGPGFTEGTEVVVAGR